MRTFIHTINVVSDNEPEKQEYLKDTICKNGKFRSIYNLNKPSKLEKYTEFSERCNNLFETLEYPYINRVDIAWDSESEEFFHQNKKKFRYLCTAFMLAYQSKNSFSVLDLLTDDTKSFWVKCSYFDVTFYNKGLQIEGKSEEEMTQARFELRLKRLFVSVLDDLKMMIAKQTKNKFVRALQFLDDVQKEYNKYLIKIFKSGTFRKTSELVVAYQDRIFTKNQLIELLQELDAAEVDKVKKAENLMYRYNIEFLTEKDMTNFVQDLLIDLKHYLTE